MWKLYIVTGYLVQYVFIINGVMSDTPTGKSDFGAERYFRTIISLSFLASPPYGFEYVGCFLQNHDYMLQGGHKWGTNKLSIEICKKLCAYGNGWPTQLQYNYFGLRGGYKENGVEYGYGCNCGDFLDYQISKDDSECNSGCPSTNFAWQDKLILKRGEG